MSNPQQPEEPRRYGTPTDLQKHHDLTHALRNDPHLLPLMSRDKNGTITHLIKNLSTGDMESMPGYLLSHRTQKFGGHK